MAEQSLIPEEAKAMIGRETPRRVTWEVTKKDIQRFALATSDSNPLYKDEKYAKKTRYGGIIAPPAFVFTFTFDHGPDVTVAEDGHLVPHSDDELVVPLPVKRVMGGGVEVEYFKLMRPGDVISCKRKLLNIYEKDGKSGKLVFTVTESTYINQRDEVIAIEKSTIITR